MNAISFSYSKELSQLTIFSHSCSLWLMQLLYCCPLWTLPLSCLLRVLAITQLIISFLLSEARKSIHRENLHAPGEQTEAVCTHPLQQGQFTILLDFIPPWCLQRNTVCLFLCLKFSLHDWPGSCSMYWGNQWTDLDNLFLTPQVTEQRIDNAAGLLQAYYFFTLHKQPLLNSALELVMY